MDLLTTFQEIAKNIALPICIAMITAQVTLRAASQQIRAQAAERSENRDEERQKRRETLELAETAARGETLEAISDSIDQYIEDVRNQETPSTTPVARSLFRLSSRCSAEHLADLCRSYIQDAATAHDPNHAVEAMLDIRRRLLGWHIGHLTLADTEHLIREGHEEVLEHLTVHRPG